VFLPGARYRLAHTAHHAAGSDQVWKMMEDLFGFFGGEILAVFDDFDAVLWRFWLYLHVIFTVRL
jgi:hypothetical protein